MKRAFTLIELLVVIAIFAILAAILFPVFAQAKESAKQTQTLSQMRQLSMSVQIYAADYDDMFIPASMRTTNPADTPIIWTQGIEPYVKNRQIFEVNGTNGAYSANWSERRHQPIGYSDATGVDPLSTAVAGAAGPGTEGFLGAASFSEADETARVGLFALTPNAPKGVTTTKHRGYVFNPYNGLNGPTYKDGLPMISDRDLVTESGDVNYPTSPSLAPGALKPIIGRYFRNGRNEGRTPVVFADGHVKTYSARQLNVFGTVIWRFR
jgi:prepilin-type N-terminal cleavage/methylation domain-containing protein/prepilin-type processing-associated H-X9-DG protein